MKRNKFFIIIPFYNSILTLERAILSIINQTYNNLILLLINDGSTDESIKIAKFFSEKDKRIKLVSKPNGGYATAINFGLENMDECDYFLFVGSDDELDLEILEKLNYIINKNNQPCMIGFNCLKKYPDGMMIIDKLTDTKDVIFENNVTIFDYYKKHPSIPQLFTCRDTSRCYKASLLGNLRYFGKFGINADGIFSTLFSLKSDSFCQLPDIGYIWYLSSTSVSGSKLSLDKRIDILNNWLQFFTIINCKKFLLPSSAKAYIHDFLKHYIYFISHGIKLFKKNKKTIFKSRVEIVKFCRANNILLSKKNRLRLLFPISANCFYNIKYHGKNL